MAWSVVGETAVVAGGPAAGRWVDRGHTRIVIKEATTKTAAASAASRTRPGQGDRPNSTNSSASPTRPSEHRQPATSTPERLPVLGSLPSGQRLPFSTVVSVNCPLHWHIAVDRAQQVGIYRENRRARGCIRRLWIGHDGSGEAYNSPAPDGGLPVGVRGYPLRSAPTTLPRRNHKMPHFGATGCCTYPPYGSSPTPTV